MTYRGVVKNGVIVLDDSERLPDGTVVEVSPASNGDRPRFGNPAFGMWADRTDMTDSAEASRALRRSIERRETNG